MLFKWFNRTKKSQKMFFSKTGVPRLTFEKLALKTIFHFIKSYLWQGLFKPPPPPRPQALIFFWLPSPFSKFETEGCPPRTVEKGRTDTVNMPQICWDKTAIIWHMDTFFPLEYILGRYADGIEDLTRMTLILS